MIIGCPPSVVRRQQLLQRNIIPFFSKVGKDVTKFVVCCSRDLVLLGLNHYQMIWAHNTIFNPIIARAPSNKHTLKYFMGYLLYMNF